MVARRSIAAVMMSNREHEKAENCEEVSGRGVNENTKRLKIVRR
jgi:hypothetical protein